MKRTPEQIFGDLYGLKPYELSDSHTDTIEDNTQGIKYIVRRWQETGVVPSQVVRHPLPASNKLYPWEKKAFDLSDIPTRHEARFARKQRDAQRDIDAMRDAMKTANKVASNIEQAEINTGSKEAKQETSSQQAKQDTNTPVSEK